jgi:hypothetical protein
MLATANHERQLHARLLSNREVDPDLLTDEAIRQVILIGNEFRAASGLAMERSPRQHQLLDRVRVCLSVLADVEEDLMLASGER